MVKKLKWNLVLMSVLYLGLGIFLVLKPGTALNIVCYCLLYTSDAADEL